MAMLTWTKDSALECYGAWEDVPPDLRAALDQFGSAIEMEDGEDSDEDRRYHPPGTQTIPKLSAVDACRIAGRELEALGFVADALSNQSVSAYFRLPGLQGVIRVSDHKRGSTRPSGAEDVLAEILFVYQDSRDKDRLDIRLTEAEIRAMAAEDYRAAGRVE
jgi:hypothetical protein